MKGSVFGTMHMCDAARYSGVAASKHFKVEQSVAAVPVYRVSVCARYVEGAPLSSGKALFMATMILSGALRCSTTL